MNPNKAFIALCAISVISWPADSNAISPSGAISVYQNICTPEAGYSTFKSQVACVKNELSQLSVWSDPELRLYVLTADKLVDDVAHGRITAASARVELQKAFIEIRSRDESRARVAAEAETRADQQRQEAARLVQERETQALQVATTEKAAREQAEQYQQSQYQAAVHICVLEAQRRRDALAASNTASRNLLNIRAGAELAAGNTVQKQCERDPEWYRTITAPRPSATMHCRSDGLGDSTCISE